MLRVAAAGAILRLKAEDTDMAGKSIKDIALAVGVELTSKVEAGDVRVASVHKVLHNLAERYVKALEMEDLAAIVGENPDLLGRKIRFDAAEKSFDFALRDSLKWAIIEEAAGYRDSCEAFVVHGKVVETLVKFSERLKQKAADGTLAAYQVENVTVFIERVVRRGYLDDIDQSLLVPITKQMGTYSARIRARHSAATGLRLEHAGDAVLDTIDDLAFLADQRIAVLLAELEGELPRAGRDQNMVR
jgi:predicted DNA-binding ribbon-helix-helix protein